MDRWAASAQALARQKRRRDSTALPADSEQKNASASRLFRDPRRFYSRDVLSSTENEITLALDGAVQIKCVFCINYY
jgi:hypothetical protein